MIIDVAHIKSVFLYEKNKDLIPYSIDNLAIDTRKTINAPTCLFFCFKGKSVDGHDFIEDAYNKGIRNFVITSDLDTSLFEDANFFKVQNALKALKALAKYHRKKFKIPTIGITGSNGKTTVKEWIYTLLIDDLEICKNPRSFNSQIGVPLAISRLEKRHDIAIFEAGPGAQGDMAELEKLIQCNLGIFTNLGDAHEEGFTSKVIKAQEKALLFKDAEIVIYNDAYPLIEEALVKMPNNKKLSWGFHKSSNIQIINTEIQKDRSLKIEVKYKGLDLVFFSPLKDKASFENVMHCIALMLYLGYNPHYINQRIQLLRSLSMRLEIKSGKNNCTIINDSYSTDLLSFQMALQLLEQQNILPKKTLILTDFYQTKNQEDLYKKIAFEIDKIDFYKVILLGTKIQNIKPFLYKTLNVLSYKNTRTFIDKLQNTTFSNETILIKGARSFQLEKLLPYIARHTHNTVLEINLYALAKNLKLYSDHLDKNTKMMVMVKASAYGAGGAEVAKMLEYNKVNYLAVAYADEGIRLREAGIKLPIMVLNPEVPQFENYTKYNLEITIGTLDLLKQAQAFHLETNQDLKIHLKLDTGMKRLGFDDDSIEDLLTILQDIKGIKIMSLFSHLVGSGEEEHDSFSHRQASIFNQYITRINEKLGYKPMKHLLNSSGIVRFPEYHFDMVRLGAGLYGIDSFMPFRHIINTVLTLKTRISQIRTVAKKETIGYSRTFSAPKPMRIATLSIGYADGIPRVARHGDFHVLINDQKAPVIGNICMDMCMIDISLIEDVVEGDEVIIFGENNPVENLAKAAGTIPYEIFTGIPNRVKRIYFQ